MAQHFKKTTWWQRNKETALTVAIIGVPLLLYLSGIAAQLAAASFLTGKTKIYFNPIRCILAALNVTGLMVIIVLCVFCGLIGLWFYRRHVDKTQHDIEEDERGFDRENSGVFGTSKLMGIEEAKKYAEICKLSETTGTILGKIIEDENHPESTEKVISIPPDGKRWKRDSNGKIVTEINESGRRVPVREKLPVNINKHIMITGAPGSGKSFCFSRPSIFMSIARKESFLVTDPKGELYSDTSHYAREKGYVVKVLNLAYPPCSDSWDALAELKGAPQILIEIQKFCRIIISNTTNPNSHGDEVYINGEEGLLTALVAYVLTSPFYYGPRTLGGVYDLLVGNTDEDIGRLINADENSLAKSAWDAYAKGSEKLRGNFSSGLAGRLRVMQEEVIKNITGINDISLTLPGEVPCAYYIIMPDMHDTFKFISSLFFSLLFDKLVERSRKNMSGRLDVPVNIIMDEFIAIGQLPDFDKKLATVRSAGINISMIFQNLAQLQEAYPNGIWETLIGNCSTFVCLACNDLTTAEYISKRSGTMTTAVESTRVDRLLVPMLQVPKSEAHTHSVQKREVLQPAEVINLMSENKIVISMAGADLLVADKFPYTDMIDPATLTLENIYNYTPGWVRQMQNKKYEDEIPDDRHNIQYESTETDDDANIQLSTSEGVMEEVTPPTPDDDFDEVSDEKPVAPTKVSLKVDDSEDLLNSF